MAKKLAEMVVYISEKSRDDAKFGMTKLNKILFTADFNYYGIKGESISGATYIHLPKGPVPQGLQKIIHRLEKQGRIKIEEKTFYGYKQKRVNPIMGSDMSAFNEDELEMLNEIIEDCQPFNATNLSDWSHGLTPWIYTEDYEEIPYYSIFVIKDLPVEKAGVKWARKELTKLLGKK